MDYEDALLMEQVRPQVGADCIHPLEGDDTLSELGPTGHPLVARPHRGHPVWRHPASQTLRRTSPFG